ncbi:MAG TPA: P-loop NTPase, partial [Actinotalea sp.]|nr:P-loop NTPase [Actinotalea sp.]
PYRYKASTSQPQAAAAEVAGRAGSIAAQTRQRLVGVVENMSWFVQPDGSRVEVFGSGGGVQVAANLSRLTGAEVPLLAQVPVEVVVREGGDSGVPVVLGSPDSAAGTALREVAQALSVRSRGLAGKPLGLTPLS